VGPKITPNIFNETYFQIICPCCGGVECAIERDFKTGYDFFHCKECAEISDLISPCIEKYDEQ